MKTAPDPASGPLSELPGEKKPGMIRRLGRVGPLALGALIMPPLGTIVLVYTAPQTGPWLHDAGMTGVLVYIVAFAVLAGLALLPTYAQCALGGFAFGIVWGVPAAILGFAGGSIIGYEVARMASKDRVMQVLNERPKWRAVRDALLGHGMGGVGGVGADGAPSFWRMTGIVALLRVPPNSPFALTNLVMASVKVPRGPFILGTAIGMIPRSSIAVVLGAGIQQLNKEALTSTPMWLWAGGLVTMLVVLTIVVQIANRAIERFTRAAEIRCLVCGYAMKDLPTAICPECGTNPQG